MKVLHLSHSDHGGAGKAALRLHQGLLTLGVESKFMVLRRFSDTANVESFRNGASSISSRLLNRLRQRTITSQWQTYGAARLSKPTTFSDDRCTIDLRHHALIQQADILHLHWISYFIDQASFFTTIKDKAVVWTLHDMNPFTGGCHFAGDCERYRGQCGACPQLGSNDAFDLSANIWRRKRKSYEGQRLHLVAPSRWLGRLAQSSGLLQNTPISIIPYGLPENIFLTRDRQAARSLLDLPLDKFLILYGGVNLKDERKGYRYFAEALNKFTPSATKSIGVVLFGRQHDPSGTHIGGIESFPLGTITDERLLSACYSAADVFVTTSMEDNLPNTVLESMSCGTPVVAFDSGGIPELVRHGETGLVVARSDADGLARSIQWLLERPDARREMGCRGRDVVLREHTNPIQATRYLELYQSIASDAGAPRQLEL